MPTKGPVQKLSVPPSPQIDLRGVRPPEARARAFTGMFRVRPGQKVVMLVSTADVEQEIMNWVAEIGHRHLKNLRVETNGSAHVAIEMIKMESRR